MKNMNEMSCPASPRAPKIQQESWDDSDSPPIDLYNPSDHRPLSRSSSRNSQKVPPPLNCPNVPRSFNKPFSKGQKFSESRSPSLTSRNLSHDSNPPRSPMITTTNYTDYQQQEDTPNSNSSYYETPTSGSRSPKHGMYTPKSPRKFVFDDVSPSYDQKGKKFEYCEPLSPDEDYMDCVENQVTGSHSRHGSMKNFKSRTIPSTSSESNYSTTIDSKDKSAFNSFTSSSVGGNPFGQSLHMDEFSHGRRNMYLKRDSCMTETTQLSGDSCETNCTMMTTISSEQQPPSSNNSTVIDRNPSVRSGRRHAINITSNPGYQVLHSSHSTLDRTCSDSVVSLARCRKSTSDLRSSQDEESSTGYTERRLSQVSTSSKFRRRGSSKGGLAYLASRRSSRDSMKSACSNASIYSNDDDIAPLAFQSSTRGRQRRTSNFLELPVPDHVRPRVCSLPDRPYNPRVSDDLYRLRHFSISKGTVVNCGDSIISKRSRSNTSVNSTNSRASERSPFDGSCCGGGYANVDSMPPSPDTDEGPPLPARYRIVLLGDAGVGKTALVSQFMTSEYMHTYDASLDDEFGEKTVSVLLDDEESELVFIDHPSVEMSVENSLTTYEPHACIIVYSVVDKNSFKVAEDIINYVWRENIGKEKAVILVGNKADLARSRAISSQDGKTLAMSRDAKFIETSSGIQHNVDELLVGVLKQIRLKEKREKKTSGGTGRMKTSRTHISLHLAKEILHKICFSDITKSRSCENLHVL
ncbi:REM1 family protein [Megaselia abdita]